MRSTDLAKKRVGIFGGTFDPPHIGHLLLAETIRESFQLDEILFVPSNEPPHKEPQELTPATHRYAMVVAATLHNDGFATSAVEVNRPGRSYSVETVRLLEEELGSDVELFFITGLDSFLEIQSWKSYEELLELCSFVVVSRPDSSFDALPDALPERFHDRVVDCRGQVLIDEQSRDREGLGIFLSDGVMVDVSSTEVRARVAEGRSIRYRVTPEVERYVVTHSLYRQAEKSEVAG
jgi:nicotinate-nucleotide adenylyltransferase